MIVNFNPAPSAPRQFRGQQRADCLFQRYAKSCCDRGSHHDDSIGAWGLRSEVSIVPVPAAVEPIFRSLPSGIFSQTTQLGMPRTPLGGSLIIRQFSPCCGEPGEHSTCGQFDRASKKTNRQETEGGQPNPILPFQLRFFRPPGIRGNRSGHAGKAPAPKANPCEITFMGVLSSVAPSTSNTQRVRAVTSSSTLEKPSLA